MRNASTLPMLAYAIPMREVIPTSVGRISASKRGNACGNHISRLAFWDVWVSRSQNEYRVSPRVHMGSADMARNDPVVVSDDESIKTRESDDLEKITLEAYRHFASISSYSALTANVFLDETSMEKESMESNFGKLSKLIHVFCGTLSETLTEASVEAVGGLSASVAYAQILDAMKTLIQGKSATNYLDIMNELRLESLMNRYIAILSLVLADKGYSPTEPYWDGIGGLIVDFLNSEKRICFALTLQEVQIIHMKESVPQSKIFANPEGDLLCVMEYVQDQF